MYSALKESDQHKQTEFIFDLFTRYSNTGFITSEQVHDVIAAFKPANLLLDKGVIEEAKVEAMSRERFVGLYKS